MMIPLWIGAVPIGKKAILEQAKELLEGPDLADCESSYHRAVALLPILRAYSKLKMEEISELVDSIPWEDQAVFLLDGPKSELRAFESYVPGMRASYWDDEHQMRTLMWVTQGRWDGALVARLATFLSLEISAPRFAKGHMVVRQVNQLLKEVPDKKEGSFSAVCVRMPGYPPLEGETGPDRCTVIEVHDPNLHKTYELNVRWVPLDEVESKAAEVVPHLTGKPAKRAKALASFLNIWAKRHFLGKGCWECVRFCDNHRNSASSLGATRRVDELVEGTEPLRNLL
jgi:hypothetical protein